MADHSEFCDILLICGVDGDIHEFFRDALITKLVKCFASEPNKFGIHIDTNTTAFSAVPQRNAITIRATTAVQIKTKGIA